MRLRKESKEEEEGLEHSRSFQRLPRPGPIHLLIYFQFLKISIPRRRWPSASFQGFTGLEVRPCLAQRPAHLCQPDASVQVETEQREFVVFGLPSATVVPNL